MAETKPKSDTNEQSPSTPPPEVAERPEVQTLVEKAQAGKGHVLPHGTVKTGADTAGGGGTKTLEPVPESPPKPKP